MINKFLTTALILFPLATLAHKGDDAVRIVWNDSTAKVVCPTPSDSLKIRINGGHVIINNKYQSRRLTFLLSGQCNNGSLRYKGKNKCTLVMENLTLNNYSRCPLDIKNIHPCILSLKGNNTISVCADTLDAAIVRAKGNLTINGNGSLQLTSGSIGCKGIKVGKDLTIDSGTIHIATSGMYVNIDTTSNVAPKMAPHPDGRPRHFAPANVHNTTQLPESKEFTGPPGKQKYNGTSKATRVKGNIVINGGVLDIRTSAPGAEGLEGRTSVTINGGEIYIDAYDDGINSQGKIMIAGGKIRVISRHNDAVDSNSQAGTGIIISGGDCEALTLAGSPEEGLDCDLTPIIVTGGRAIAIGGAMSSSPSVPNNQTAAQPTLLICNRHLSAGDTIRILNDKGRSIFTYTSPHTVPNAYITITSPYLKKDKTYRIVMDGSKDSSATFTSRFLRL